MVNRVQNNLFVFKPDEKNDVGKSNVAVSGKGEQISVRVSISEEGMEKYQNKVQKNSSKLDEIMEQRDELLSGKIMPETDYSFELGNTFAALKEDGRYLSTGEKAGNLLKAYANLYDDIVQGYESGTREQYVQDSAMGNGYRKLTMAEELDSLNVAYKKYAEFLETQAKMTPQIAEAHEKYMNKLSKIGADRAEMAKNAADVYARGKEETVPENISEKMIEASKTFAKQYASQSMPERDILIILENIKMFG